MRVVTQRHFASVDEAVKATAPSGDITPQERHGFIAAVVEAALDQAFASVEALPSNVDGFCDFLLRNSDGEVVAHVTLNTEV